MAAINFPINPSNGQVFAVGNYTYTYSSAKSAWLGTISTTSTGGITTGKSIAMAIVFGG